MFMTPVQHAWENEIDNVTSQNPDRGMDLDNVILLFLKACHAGLKPATIQKAWKNCGYAPFNPDCFNSHHFAPSQHTSSTAATLPLTYPVITAPYSEGLDSAGADVDGGSKQVPMGEVPTPTVSKVWT
jgi:hypothetical protein